MSSMFKKKGGLAFKPKIPSARPRPTAPARSQPSKPSEESVSLDAHSPPPQQDNLHDTAPAPKPISSGPDEATVSDVPDLVAQTVPTPLEPSTDVVEENIPVPPVAVTTEKEAPEKSSERESQSIGPDVQAEERRDSIQETLSLASRRGSQLITETSQKQPSDQSVSDVSAPAINSTEETDTTETTVTPSTDEVEPSVQPSIEAPPKQTPTRKPRTRKAAAAAAAAANQEAAGEDGEATRPKKRQRKTLPADSQDGETKTPRKPRKRKEPTQDGAQSETKPRRARSMTPEDSENQVVDLQKLKMSDLTKDLHIGKKFSRHDELRERERRRRMRSKTGEPPDGEGEKEDSATPGAAAKKGSPAVSSPAPTPALASGPQLRVVDGQIVVDQSSLVMDRHARDAAAQGDMETIEENDFTRLITSNSFMTTSKLRGPNIWTDEETELFYRGLCMFGTSFEIISHMFPGKRPRHIKLKYNREERHNPSRITAAITGEKTTKIDLDEYKAMTGAEFESVESIEAEQRKIQEDFEAEQKRVADEQAEINRKKREELFADDDDDAAAKKKKKGKRKRETVVYGLDGNPIPAEEA